MLKSIAALLFCALSVALVTAGENPASPDTTVTPASTHKIVVSYLFFNPRCETCLNMEAFAKEAVEANFSQELRQGLVVWQSLDIEQPEHRHFWDDYSLETKALIIAEWKDGAQLRWKDCVRIWDLADNKPDFLKYVQAEVRAYLPQP